MHVFLTRFRLDPDHDAPECRGVANYNDTSVTPSRGRP